MWEVPDTLEVCFCFCTYHNEDGHMSGRNLSLIAMQYNYTHTSKSISWSFKNQLINARNMEHKKNIYVM
jgi:hypothetical protein